MQYTLKNKKIEIEITVPKFVISGGKLFFFLFFFYGCKLHFMAPLLCHHKTKFVARITKFTLISKRAIIRLSP